MVQSYDTHPVRQLYDCGVPVALSSDNHLISGAADRPATAVDELAHLVADASFTWPEALQVLLHGARAVFGVPVRKSGDIGGSGGGREEFLDWYKGEVDRVAESCG